MNLTEILKAKGVSEEVITSVLEDMKANKIYTAGEENLDVRYSKLKADHDGLTQQYTEANNLIAELKKSNKGNEDLQQKITDYEGQVAQLQAELAQNKLDSAIKIELLSSKALDVDYLAFKLKEKGELELDEQGKIKGWNDKLAALKTQFPTQFASEGKKIFADSSLPSWNSGETVTLEQFRKMGVEERSKLKAENEDLYNQYKGK